MKIDKPTQLWKLTFEGAWTTDVSFIGSSRLAVGNRSGQLLVWDLPEKPGKPPENVWPTRLLDGHRNAITHLVATPDGKTLVSSSLDRTVCLWETAQQAAGSANVILDSEEREKKARRLPKEKRQELLDAPGVKVETQQPTQVLKGHRDWINALGISRNGKRLVSGDATSLVIAWDLATRKEVSRWTGHKWNGIVAAALSPDGESALISENSYKRDDFDLPAPGLKLWDVASGMERLDILKIKIPKLKVNETSYSAASVWRKFIAGGLIAADFSPDGKLFAVGQGGETGSGRIYLFETSTGKEVRALAEHRGGVTDVKFSHDGEHVLSTGRDGQLQINKTTDGKEVARLGKPRGGQFKDWLYAVAVSPDQKLVAASDIAGMVHVWQLSS